MNPSLQPSEAARALLFLHFAHEVLEKHPQAYRAMQRLAAQALLGDLLTVPLWRPEHEDWMDLALWIDWGEATTLTGQRLLELSVQHPTPRSGALETDVVIPVPWSRDRLARALGAIGPDCPWGAWAQQDDHSVLYLEPLDLFWVESGNHSFSAGVLLGRGQITAEGIEDHRAVYPHVRLEPHGYVRAQDGLPIAEVQHWAVAALFELGRWRLNPPVVGGHPDHA